MRTRCHSARCSRYRLLIATLLAQLTVGEKTVTIHVDKGPYWWKIYPEALPCFQLVPQRTYLKLSDVGCHSSWYDDFHSRSVWVVPESQGPIRLLNDRSLCLDASAAASYLQQKRTNASSISMDSLLRRIIEVRPCDGSVYQTFAMIYNSVDGSLMRLELPLDTTWFVSHEVDILLLGERPAHPQLTVLEYRGSPEAVSSQGHFLLTMRRISMILLTIKMVFVIVYLGVVLKQMCCCGLSLLPSSAKSTAKAFWVFLWKAEGKAVRRIATQRRLRRAQLLINYSVHCSALWAILSLNKRIPSYKYPWMQFEWTRTGIKDQMIMTDSELIPMLFVLIVSVCAQVRPIRSALTLDALTILFAFVFALQHYLMSQSISGLNVDLYLYNASWMLVLHMCVNLAFGRAVVTVPCTIVVAIVDVHYFGSLMQKNRTHSFVFSHYHLKQIAVCCGVCFFQISFDVLRSKEFQAAVALNSANLHEQLATKLTDSMCDAVVHLDGCLNLAKPAPKLGYMLFRDKLGMVPTNFRKFVVPDDHERFENHMKYAASADTSESLVPQHFALLDSSGCSCKVQMFVSAFYDDEKAVNYILGITEVVDFQRKQKPVSTSLQLDDTRHSVDSDIPEGSIVDSSDGEIGIASSCASGSIEEQNTPVMEVSICQRTGVILQFSSSFHSWTEAACRGKYFPSLFHNPSEVWEWLQTSAHRFTLVQSDATHTFERKAFTSVRRDAVVEVELMFLGAKSHVDGAGALDLLMRILKYHKKRSTRRRRSSKDPQTPRTFTLRAVGSCIQTALDAAEEVAEQMYKPMLGTRWGEWVNWWNLCINSIEDAPFQSSQGDFEMELTERGPDDYAISLQLRRAATNRTALNRRVEASTIGSPTLQL
eukprot:TRINITY_DN2070_c0_g5_i1.p1 TRINITY_DN2070_c0_g5~~TRINITY_DN2070_c0_g5_i1.p1  ORF type:complete len:878 (-),score=47.93 TRINITY_DN2070_c0_g5_i1:116-2749(-)